MTKGGLGKNNFMVNQLLKSYDKYIGNVIAF